MRAYSLLLALLLTAVPAAAQERPDTQRPPAEPVDCSRPTYGVGGAGSRCVVGVRASLRQSGDRRVTGLELSLLDAPFDMDSASPSAVRGVALALTGPSAGELTGINLGLTHVYGARALRGISVGGLLAGAEVETRGLTLGGLFAGGGKVDGVTVGGLAVIGKRFRGVQAGGVGVFGGDVAGVSAGFGVVGERIRGVTGTGWMAQAGPGGLHGITASIVGVQSRGPIRGITGAGVAVLGRQDVSGVTAAFGGVEARDMNGLAAGGITRVHGTQRGVTLGLVNRAGTLRGVQVGLLNEARNNPRLLRWLPGVNVHL